MLLFIESFGEDWKLAVMWSFFNSEWCEAWILYMVKIVFRITKKFLEFYSLFYSILWDSERLKTIRQNRVVWKVFWIFNLNFNFIEITQLVIVEFWNMLKKWIFNQLLFLISFFFAVNQKYSICSSMSQNL